MDAYKKNDMTKVGRLLLSGKERQLEGKRKGVSSGMRGSPEKRKEKIT